MAPNAETPDRGRVESDIRGRMPRKLFDHTLNVAAFAAELAAVHGADADWMYLAGLYHDLGKTFDLAGMKAAAEEGGVEFDGMESVSPSLMHAAAGAAIFKKDLQPPEAFVRAVRGHTVGIVPFGREEQILYVADFSEPTRPYEECETVRRTAKVSLRQAALEAVSFKIRFLMLRNKTIHPRSVEVYNHLLAAAGKT